MLKDLLDFVENQPKTVVAALFSIIVVGGVGGSVWIQTLLSQVESSDDRIKLIKAQYKKANSTLTEENLVLKRQLAKIKNQVASMSTTLQTEADKIKSVVKDSSNNKNPLDSITESVTLLEKEASSLTVALTQTEEMSDLLGSIREAQIPDALMAPRFPIYTILIVILVITIVLILIRRRHK